MEYNVAIIQDITCYLDRVQRILYTKNVSTAARNATFHPIQNNNMVHKIHRAIASRATV